MYESDKRYQVFVSSTFRDLEAERQEVMHALLELDCIPSGMELFPAANDSQWDLIKKTIDDCDYYILILAGRYGSIGPDGLSYTEMEYRYAVETEKPIIAFLHGNLGAIPSSKAEDSPEARRKLAEFRSLAQTRLCKMWETPQELGSVVSRSITRLTKSTPAIGWVRADKTASKDAEIEILRLKLEIDKLKTELLTKHSNTAIDTTLYSQGNDSIKLNYVFSARRNDSAFHADHDGTFYTTWNAIFAAVAPYLIDSIYEAYFIKIINEFIEKECIYIVDSTNQYDIETIDDFRISKTDFQTLKIQFRALGLIIQSDKDPSEPNRGTKWTLTPAGDQLMVELRAIRRGAIDTTEASPIPENIGTR